MLHKEENHHSRDIYIYIKIIDTGKNGKSDKKMYLEKENKTVNSSPTFTLMKMVIAKVLHVLENLRMLLVKCEWIGKITTEIKKSNVLMK